MHMSNNNNSITDNSSLSRQGIIINMRTDHVHLAASSPRWRTVALTTNAAPNNNGFAIHYLKNLNVTNTQKNHTIKSRQYWQRIL